MNKVALLLSLILCCSCASFNSQKEKLTIDQLINKWHQSAAVADEDVFFGFFAPDGIYIGTDKSEYWTPQELKEWSKKFFDRDSAWDFKPLNRHIYFSHDGSVAWFDEHLDTWMGTCKGSGVLEKINDEWMLKHYDLSIAVPNEKVQDFLKL